MTGLWTETVQSPGCVRVDTRRARLLARFVRHPGPLLCCRFPAGSHLPVLLSETNLL